MMDFLRIVALLIFSFGIYAFGTLVVYQLRQGGRRMACDPRSDDGTALVGLAINSVCFGWFLFAMLVELASLTPHVSSGYFRVAHLALSYAFPALIMHVFYARARAIDPSIRSGPWKWSVVAAYGISHTTSAILLLGVLELIPIPRSWLGPSIGGSITVLFTAASIYSVRSLSRFHEKRVTREERSSNRWMLRLFYLLILMCGLLFVLNFPGVARQEVAFGISLITTCMPLLFVFTGLYHDAPFEFFDLFIKRGMALIATIVLLTAFFGLVQPALDRLELVWARPWAYAVVLMPAVMLLPWVYRRLGGWLDTVWLGRRFTPAEAVKYFLSSLQGATDERGLIERAQQGLSTIFQAPVRIGLGLHEVTVTDFDCALELPLAGDGRRGGVILMGRRASRAPYFSEDTALLASLAEVLSRMLQNLHLQERKQQQEQQTRELSLQASRSELKALRAQINPHFLFNALNAIAGLIHKNPLRADSTIEQLAEVFRYTLRGSDKEWVMLSEELEFVQAYLDVEQARFGERLTTSVRIDDFARSVRIPTMLVQTLVENAVKHGIGANRGPGRIEIDALREDGNVRIRVADSGPGFSQPAAGDDAPRKTGGYGLKNIRERLQGHFGDEASLTIERDEVRAMTVVSITMPCLKALQPERRRRAGNPGGAS